MTVQPLIGSSFFSCTLYVQHAKVLVRVTGAGLTSHNMRGALLYHLKICWHLEEQSKVPRAGCRRQVEGRRAALARRQPSRSSKRHKRRQPSDDDEIADLDPMGYAALQQVFILSICWG